MTPVMSLERVQMLRFLLTDEALTNIREAIQFWLEVEAEEDSVKTVETFEENVDAAASRHHLESGVWVFLELGSCVDVQSSSCAGSRFLTGMAERETTQAFDRLWFALLRVE